MFDFLKKLFGRPTPASHLEPECYFIIKVCDSEVRCTRPDGHVERVAWDDLQTVIVQTTSDGPCLPDVFWILAGSSASSGCVIPQGATGGTILLQRLQKLPGFDGDAFLNAMSCTDDRKFLCWQRTK
jgi:hypothetical protein